MLPGWQAWQRNSFLFGHLLKNSKWANSYNRHIEKILQIQHNVNFASFLRKWPGLFLSVQRGRIQKIILAVAQNDYTGKMPDCSELGAAYRTVYGHFLAKGKWNHEKVEFVHRKNSFKAILPAAQSTNQPVYLSIDDTVVAKKKPSRRAVRPSEGMEKKQVCGFQMHTSIASTGNDAICYGWIAAVQNTVPKVNMAAEWLFSLHLHLHKTNFIL